MESKGGKDVEDWLKKHEGFARTFVDDYIHSHPLFLKELVQQEMEKKQQQLFSPICTARLNIPNHLTPKKSMRHVRSAPNIGNRKSATQLRMLNKQELLMELLKDVVSPDFDVNSMSHKILVNVLLLTNADRSSLFLVEGSEENPILVSRLFDVTEDSTLESVIHDESEAIKIPFGVGIVGQVAQTGDNIILEDAYKDSRFNTRIDKLTGYRTKAVMCMPIKTIDGHVIGVAQVINKKGGGEADHFSEEDQEVFKTYLTFCAIGLVNVQLFDQSFALSQQLQVLLQLARGLFEDATSLQDMMKRIMTEAQELIPCKKAIILLLEEDSSEDDISFNQGFELDVASENPDELKVVKPSEIEDLETSLNVVKHKQMIAVTDADSSSIQIDHKASSVLCMPIFNNTNKVIGVVILKDKLNGLPFNKSEEEAFQVFATFCGLGVQNVMNYEKIFKANAKQSVALEVLSYHATASEEDTVRLMDYELPMTKSIYLDKFEFDDLTLSDDETVLTSVRMFVDLGLVNKFHIDMKSLYRFVLSVRKNYRPVTYHNWRHAFNVAQSMYSVLMSGGMGEKMNDLEKLGLLVGCFCHDLDHRGTNNAFQTKTESHLAQLYSTSTMEHHHFDHCIMILTSNGNRIFQRLSAEQYETVIHVLESAILSTDLALYFKKKGNFANLVHNHEFVWENQSHRDTLRGMMMTACDVAAITKPWPIQLRTAELVASEFFEQGDRERNDLHLEPMAMMDRKKKDELPKMQVGFINGICLSLYEVLSDLEPGLSPLLDGCKANRQNWQDLADKEKEFLHTTPATQPPTSTTTPNNTGTVPNNKGSVPPIEAWRSSEKVTQRKAKCIIS